LQPFIISPVIGNYFLPTNSCWKISFSIIYHLFISFTREAISKVIQKMAKMSSQRDENALLCSSKLGGGFDKFEES
jgi:hypothetical protein